MTEQRRKARELADRIIHLGRNHSIDEAIYRSEKLLLSFADAECAAERARCAKIASNYPDDRGGTLPSRIAAAISKGEPHD